MSGLIEVGGSGDPSLVAPVLTQLGAKGHFSIEGHAEFMSRNNDTSPFKGGGQIQGPSYLYPGTTAGCTAGWPVYIGSYTWMGTAGHCFALGGTVTTPTGTVEGSADKHAIFPDRDMELYRNKTYAGSIYISSTSLEPVGSSGSNPVVGITYCTSGAYGGRQCDKVATGVNIYHCWTFYSGCSDMMTTFTNGSEIQHGDSGGPYYLDSIGKAWARGTISAVENNGVGYAQEWSEWHAWWNANICSTTPC